MNNITYFRTKHFDRALNAAKLGPNRRQAEKVSAIIGRISDGDPFFGMKTTNHGETRIPKCVKYDLGDGWRLVTVQDSRICGFVFVGDHEDADKFLNRNKGTKYGVSDGRIVEVPGRDFAKVARGIQVGSAETLLEILGDDHADFITNGLKRSAMQALDRLTPDSSTEEIMGALQSIEDARTQNFVGEVLALVLAGDEDGWFKRIAYEKGEIVDTEAVDPDQIIRVEDGDSIREIEIGSSEYQAYIKLLQRDSKWQDWFLYLHPEQEKVVLKDFDGPAQLSGVSGSGKTCVLVRRAVRLAGNPDAKVAILTLNRSLAGMLKRLVAACGDEGEVSRIEVLSFFDLAKGILAESNPSETKSLDDTTWKLAEHVDEIFREYFRCWLNNDSADVLDAIRVQLSARGICPETYIREEFDWVRSALDEPGRESYLDIERTGRRVPIMKNRRRDILAGLKAWEAKMSDVGVVDYAAITGKLSTVIHDIQPQYDHILVDEAQDFGTTELSLLRHLVRNGNNDIFLCGDIAQTVLPKQRLLKNAGVEIVSRERIQKNYRNSREILKAAHELLIHNLDEELFEDGGLELLDPQFANFSSSPPLALYTESLEREIAFARKYAQTRLKADAKSVCIAFCGFTARDVQEFARHCGTEALHGFYDPLETPLVFSDLEQTKGYEFDTLIVVNCSEGVIPASSAPPEEAFRQGCKLYVAMTRARHELILSFNGNSSPWLQKVADTIAVEAWDECEEFDTQLLVGEPAVLPELSEQSGESDLAEMNGREFLYTSYALGLSAEAQEKLRELVDGRGALSSNGSRTKWKTISALAIDLGKNKRSDNLFGSKVSEEVRDRLAKVFPDIQLYPSFTRAPISRPAANF